jgi:hypothetical protein
MDFHPVPKLLPEVGARRLGGILAFLGLAHYAVFLALHVGAIASGSDSSGYMNHARLLAAGHLHVAPRIIPGLPQSEGPPFLYVPLGFKPAWNGDGMVPTYPPGFALFVVALKPLVGWRHAGDWAIILHSLAGVVATYALACLVGLGRRWSAVAAVIVASSPLYLFSSLQAMSDVPSLAWTTGAVLAALLSRNRAAWALAAGAALAVDVLLRPANVLAFVPVGIALGLSPKRWALLIAAGLPGAAFFIAHSASAYGKLFTTGYGDFSFGFRLAYVPGTLLHYGIWVPALFTPIALLVLLLPWLSGVPARVRWILGSWVFVFAAFYSAYVCTHETWWYLRFLLPAAPAFVIGGLLVLRRLLERTPAFADSNRSWIPWAALCLVAVDYSGGWSHRLHALSIGQDELRYTEVADWLNTNLPSNSVCLAMQASGSIYYYTHFAFVRWDALEPATTGKVEAALRKSGRPLYAVLFPFERDDSEVLERRMPGHWTEVKQIKDVTIWRRDFDAPKT